MGTRGAYGFRIGGKDKVTYNHFDSYPSGLGESVLVALASADLGRVKTVAEGIEMVDEGATPTDAQIKICQDRGLVNLGVSRQDTSDWYCLLRNAQGDIEALLNGRVPFMSDGAGFLTDSLFCEWAYIINLDEGVLEVYKGFNKVVSAPGRYAPLGGDGQGYFGVALIDSIPLASVRDMGPDAISALIAGWESRQEA